MQQANKNKLFFILIVVLMVALGNIVFHHFRTNQTPSTCNLYQRACTVQIKNQGSVTVNATPKLSATQMQLSLQVSLTGISAQKLEANIIQDNNFANTVKLPLEKNKQATDNYTASTVLNRDPTKPQNWLILVLINTQSGNIAVPLHMDVTKEQ